MAKRTIHRERIYVRVGARPAAGPNDPPAATRPSTNKFWGVVMSALLIGVAVVSGRSLYQSWLQQPIRQVAQVISSTATNTVAPTETATFTSVPPTPTPTGTTTPTVTPVPPTFTPLPPTPTNSPVPQTPTDTPVPSTTERRSSSSQQTADCIQPPDGLVSWWPGDGNADDIIGANNGKLVGGVEFTDGIVGQAFRFKRSNDFIEILDNANLDLPGALTINAWVKIHQTNTFNIVLAKRAKGLDRNYQLTINSGGTVRFENTNGNRDTDAAITLDVWHHLAATHDGANTAKIYINGNLSKIFTLAPAAVNNSALRIGHDCDGCSFMDGLIDEVVLYNRALTDQEIEDIFEAGSAGMCKSGVPIRSMQQPAQHLAQVVPTATATAIPTDTLPGTILEEGQTWRQEGVELTLKNVDFTDAAQGYINFQLTFMNHKPQEIYVKYSLANYTVMDNLRHRYRNPGSEIGYNCGGYSWNMENTIAVPTGLHVYLHPGHCKAIYIGGVAVGNSNLTEITITISGVSSINEARWRIPIYH